MTYLKKSLIALAVVGLIVSAYVLGRFHEHGVAVESANQNLADVWAATEKCSQPKCLEVWTTVTGTYMVPKGVHYDKLLDDTFRAQR